MNIPNLVEVSTLSAQIASCKETFEKRNPALLESESDYYMPIIEAQGEREFRLRVEINKNFKNQFWMVAEGEWLDFAAREFGVTRLGGSKPWAFFEITLDDTTSIDISIPAQVLIGGEEAITAHTIEAVTIAAGEKSVKVRAVLDLFVSRSDIKTEQVLTPLPYMTKIKQLESWHDGEGAENDEQLRQRISVALDSVSGAGPASAYRKFVLGADARIRDVKVFSHKGRIQIVVDSDEWDDIMQKRIKEATSAEDKRPLNDAIDLHHAAHKVINVEALLRIKSEAQHNDVIKRSIAAVRVLNNSKIGESVSIARVIESLFVEGVMDVALSSPVSNTEIGTTEVFRLGHVAVSYA